MRARLLVLLLLLTASLAARAGDQTADLTDIAKAIRDGKVDVGKEFSVDHKTGRYHTIHVDVLGMDCNTCHFGDRYHADYLLMGKDKPYVKRSKGRYDRSACLGCHREGAEGTPFYGTAAVPK